MPPTPRSDVYALIDAERARQAVKWAGPHDHGEGDCSSPYVSDLVKLAVLTEEAGEVARGVLDSDVNLHGELVQVAAVAVAWLEGMDAPGEGATQGASRLGAL